MENVCRDSELDIVLVKEQVTVLQKGVEKVLVTLEEHVTEQNHWQDNTTHEIQDLVSSKRVCDQLRNGILVMVGLISSVLAIAVILSNFFPNFPIMN